MDRAHGAGGHATSLAPMPPERKPRDPLPRGMSTTTMSPAATAGAPAPPATAEDIGASVVDCGVYDAGRRRGGRMELQEALREAAACEDGFVWIGLHEPRPGVVQAVAEQFGLPPLAVEDAVNAHQRPKLEVYGELLFCVLKTARYVDSEELVQIGELMVFVGPHFAVTVRHGTGTPLATVRADLEAHPDLLAIGPTSVIYAVADRVVDDYAVVLDGLANDIEEIEAQVFSDSKLNAAERIYRLKREVLEFKRAVYPLGGPLLRLAARQGGLPMDPRASDHFRDVHDHCTRDADRLAGFDELLSGVLQANLAQLTVRDNQDMRRISAWLAMIAVPTMVFGIYGMNFEHMPELKWRFGYPLVLTMVLAVCGALYWRFRRVGWL